MATTERTGVLSTEIDGTQYLLYPEVKTDTTLTESGKAADSAAVGQKIADELENLIPFPYDSSNGWVQSGVTWTYDEEGVIYATGTATANSAFNLTSRQDTATMFSLSAGTYTLTGGMSSNRCVGCGYSDADGNYVGVATDSGQGATFTLNEDIANFQIQVLIKTSQIVDKLPFKVMLVKGNTAPSEYRPYNLSCQSLRDDVDANTAKLDATNIAYGTCSTDAATSAKVVAISSNDNWQLKVGSIVVVKFTNTNTASNVTLNVNNTGAKSIWYGSSVYTGNSNMINGYADRFIMYMYDGTYWIWLTNSADANNTYSPATLGQGYGTCTTAEATTAKVVSLSSYALVTGGVVAVKFTYNVPASATMNINSKGAKAIYYRGAAITANVIKAGDTAIFIYNGSQYHLLTVDRDVDTNTDTKVTQTVKSDNATYPLLLAPSGQTADTTTTACFDSGVTLNPSTNTIAANVSGNAGTATTWANARNINGMHINGSGNRFNYGTCSTAAATVAKTVACTGYALDTGSEITVKFTVTNTAANPTLNVNNTGAKPIYYRGSAISAGYLASNRTYTFRYNGTQYELVGDLDANNYDRIRYSFAVKCGATAIVAGNLIVGKDGAYQHLKSGQAFDITYPILYATQAIAANGTNTQTHKAIPMTVTTTQSITLTAYKPVYIKGKLSGTTFTPVSTTPLTQTVPTSVDGYQYIKLGLAYSGTQMMLEAENPIYEYNGGEFGLYSERNEFYAVCEDTGSVDPKVVNCPGFKLYEGAKITVNFTQGFGKGRSINVNNTGSYVIKFRGSTTANPGCIKAGVYDFIFDGTNYVVIGDEDLVISSTGNGFLMAMDSGGNRISRVNGTNSINLDTGVFGGTATYAIGDTDGNKLVGNKIVTVAGSSTVNIWTASNNSSLQKGRIMLITASCAMESQSHKAWYTDQKLWSYDFSESIESDNTFGNFTLNSQNGVYSIDYTNPTPGTAIVRLIDFSASDYNK